MNICLITFFLSRIGIGLKDFTRENITVRVGYTFKIPV